MKTLKSRLFMFTLLLAGAVAMSFVFNKEKPESKVETKAETTWHYVGTENPGVFFDADNWEIGASTAPGCGPIGTIPCQLKAEAEDKEELIEYLDGMDNDDVLGVSETVRN